MSLPSAPIYMKDAIEAIRCRTCGAEGGSCFGPQREALIASVAFQGQEARTEFCYARVHDYFETLRPSENAYYDLTNILATRSNP